MKFSILAVSASVFLFNQVFAAPTDAGAAVEAKVNADANMNVAQPTMSELDNALEADLMSHGYDKKDAQLLTTFLESVDRFGDMVNEVTTLDPASAEALAEFQESTKQLLADAGYEFRQLDDNRRVLTRVSSETATFQEELIPELIKKIVDTINNQIANFISTLQKNGVPGFVIKILNFFAGIIKKIGDAIVGIFGGGAKSSTS